MLIPFTALRRESASDEYKEYPIGLNPFGVGHAEADGEEESQSLVWCDGMDKPYRIKMACNDFIGIINELTCEPESCDTA